MVDGVVGVAVVAGLSVLGEGHFAVLYVTWF